MYTQCPHCATLFRVSAADLRAGQGKVRCGACNMVFNALGSLNDAPPAIPTVSERIALAPETPLAGITENPVAAAPPTLHTGTPAPEILSAPAAQPYTKEPAPRFSAFDTEQPEQVIEDRQVTKQQVELAAPTPAFETGEPQAVKSTVTDAEPYPFAPPPPARKPYGWFSTGVWSAALVGLIALLLAQYLYFSRNELARHAELRPMLSAFCTAVSGLVPCEIPLRRDLNRIEVENRTVQPHPAAPNALLVHLTLANRARFAQPYPVLELSFTDLNANLIAQRRFQPDEYLAPGVNISKGMTPDIPLQVMLELAAPDNGLNFELSSWNLALY